MGMLNITHNSGFFSCPSVRLIEIINYFNNNKSLPDLIDSSKQYVHFKNNLSDDLTKIMSMCKILITHSGNCGLWSVLYRGNTNNVFQYLNHYNNGGVWFNNYI